jgi:hypothetical protein
MALAPHWLDDVFKQGGGSASAIASTILGDDRFKTAIEHAVSKGLDAMKESEEAFRRNPNLMAPSPEQAARKEFVAALGNFTGNG